MNMMLRISMNTDTVLCPDKGLPRLIRYDLPDNDIDCVAVLNIEQNLLRVNRVLFDMLTPMQQDWVIKTRKQYLYRNDLSVY